MAKQKITLDQLASSTIVAIQALNYPVGSYYWNETDSTNPGTLLGFGTWTAVTDKFIVARGSTYTSTGGSATHTHDLSDSAWAQITASASAGTDTLNIRRLTTGVTTWNGTVSNSTSISFSASGTARTSGTALDGVTDAGSTIPPYQAAYCWKRTA